MSHSRGETNAIELIELVAATFHLDLCRTTQEREGFAERMLMVGKDGPGFDCLRARAEPLCGTSTADEFPKRKAGASRGYLAGARVNGLHPKIRF